MATVIPPIVNNPQPIAIVKTRTQYSLTSAAIASILQNNGGIIDLPTSGSPGLDNFEQRFWIFHTPLGQPGDTIWSQEDFRITRVCQSNDGFTITVEYRDGDTRSYESSYSAPLAPAGTWSPASTMLFEHSRVKLEISSISSPADFSKWQFTCTLIPAIS